MEEESRSGEGVGEQPAWDPVAVQRAWRIVRAVLRLIELVAVARNDESLCLAAQALVVLGDAVVRA
jgi:hypothetical protein